MSIAGSLTGEWGIAIVTDEKGRKVAVQIDPRKHGARLQGFWDGLISESRRSKAEARSGQATTRKGFRVLAADSIVKVR